MEWNGAMLDFAGDLKKLFHSIPTRPFRNGRRHCAGARSERAAIAENEKSIGAAIPERFAFMSSFGSRPRTGSAP
jgi:hypothetical protein